MVFDSEAQWVLPLQKLPPAADIDQALSSFGPGGGTDILARLLVPRVSDALGQQVVVDNRPGAGGNIGAELAAKAPADGYTLLMVDTSYAVNPSLYAKLPFDPAKDFEPITNAFINTQVLVVSAALNVSSLDELAALPLADHPPTF